VVDRSPPPDLRRLPDGGTIRVLFGSLANVVVLATYATQREYEHQRFKPYLERVRRVVWRSRPESSRFWRPMLLLPQHQGAADEGTRSYVMDLVIAHRRQWGWRFVDTFCWRKTDTASGAGEPIQELGTGVFTSAPAAD